jgi:putative transcriptional regulator
MFHVFMFHGRKRRFSLQYKPRMAKPLKGHLLIASPRLMDPNFARAVVLMVQHDDEGSLGLILNRPVELSLADIALQILDEELDIDGNLLQGGPCEGPLMTLHEDSNRSQIDVGDGVHFTADPEDVSAMLREPGDRTRFFAGYAGWGAGQLDAELEVGSWLITPATPSQIFDPGTRVWQKWVTILTAELKLSPDALPDDPSVN